VVQLSSSAPAPRSKNADDSVFGDLLDNLHLHLRHEVDVDRFVELRRTSAAAVMSRMR
jgi:hypothetical protein